MDRVEAFEHDLGSYLHTRHSSRLGATGGGRAALCAFNVTGCTPPTDLATFLDQEGIAIRSGHHCTQPLHAELVRRGRSAYDGSARASLYIYLQHARGGGVCVCVCVCVDILCAELESTIELFRSME